MAAVLPFAILGMSLTWWQVATDTPSVIKAVLDSKAVIAQLRAEGVLALVPPRPHFIRPPRTEEEVARWHARADGVR